MVRAALKIRSSHRQFIECEKISQNRTKWSSLKCRDWFNSGTQFCLGTFEMVISFLPTRFIKLIQLAGFSGNREVSLDYLLSAFNLKNTFMHPWTAVMLSLYYGFLEYFYGKQCQLNNNKQSILYLVEECNSSPSSVCVCFHFTDRVQ